MADFVAGGGDTADEGGMAFGDPAGDIEGGGDVVRGEQVEDQGRGDGGTVFSQRQRGRSPFDFGILADGGRGTVEIEGEDDSAVPLGTGVRRVGAASAASVAVGGVWALIAITDRAV